MSYLDWPSRKEKIGALFLDPKNPRLPKKDDLYTQNEIIEELLIFSNVKEIASSISDEGYIPLEQLIIFKDTSDGKKYVLEGNRRLTACKLIRNPNLAPPEFQAFFKRIAKKVDPNEISKLQVLEAPDRESALKMLVKKHTKPTIADWKPIMKAHFYVQPLEDGLTIKEASEILGVTEGEIKDARFLLQMYEASKKLHLEPEVREIVENEYKFNLSTFERVIGKATAKKFLGVEQNDEGHVKTKLEATEFKKGLKRIVSDIALEIENSRSLNKNEDIDEYLTKKISVNDRPDLSKTTPSKLIDEIFVQEVEIEEEDHSITVESAPVEKKRTQVPRSPIGLFYKSTLVCEHDNQKLKDIIRELSEITPKKYPNSVAMSLRMLLELASYEFLKSKNELSIWEAEQRIANPRLATLWTPELKQMLLRIVNKNLLNDPSLTRALGLVINDGSSTPILNHLNQFVHNSSWHPNEEKLRNIWKDLQPCLKSILLKSKTPQPSAA